MLDLDPKDIRITEYYLGPENGSSIEAVHIPTGISVAESITASSTETGSTIHLRLLLALEQKIKEGGKSGKA